jgi:fumarate hydratase class II
MKAITRAASDLIDGRLDGQFPLPVWPSGSGQEIDTNVNEVLANRAIQLLQGSIGEREPVDPDRDVAACQSVGSCFTTTLHIALVMEIEEALVPAVLALARMLDRKAIAGASHGRRLREALVRLDEAEGGLHEIVTGPTDTNGSGRSGADWQVVAGIIAADTGRPFIVGKQDNNPDLGLFDATLAAMAAVRGVAVVLHNIAGVIHASLDEQRPGGSLAPLEAMARICTEVLEKDQLVAASVADCLRSPHATRPLIASAVLTALHRLGPACGSMRGVLSRAR